MRTPIIRPVALLALLAAASAARPATAQSSAFGAPQRRTERSRDSAEADRPGRLPSFSTESLGSALAAAGLDTELLGGVPDGERVERVIEVSFDTAIDRALRQNLAVVLRERAGELSRSRERAARSRLFPSFELEATRRRQEFNFAASGFGDFIEGDPVVGFDRFDVRLETRIPLLDLRSVALARAAAADRRAAEHRTAEIRSAAVLFVGNLYYRTVAQQSRVAATTARLATARALHQLATDRQQAGLSPTIDVLRAEVRMLAEQQELIAEQNQLAKSKQRLARTIGLPVGQEFVLTETLAYVAQPHVALERYLELAFTQRRDLLAARERLASANQRLRAAAAARWPLLEIDGDYGEVGTGPDDTRATFGLGASLRIPLFAGGRLGAETARARAELEALEARLADLRANVYYQVKATRLDLEAAQKAVEVALRGRELAFAQLQQARNRFAAGVSDNLAVIAAQESTAEAEERLLAAQLAHRLARGAVARAIGLGDEAIRTALRAEIRALRPESPEDDSR